MSKFLESQINLLIQGVFLEKTYNGELPNSDLEYQFYPKKNALIASIHIKYLDNICKLK